METEREFLLRKVKLAEQELSRARGALDQAIRSYDYSEAAVWAQTAAYMQENLRIAMVAIRKIDGYEV